MFPNLLTYPVGLPDWNERFKVSSISCNQTDCSPCQLVWQEAKFRREETYFPVGQANRGRG